MKAERLILSLVAIFVGLLVAGGAFYVYQMTKTLPPQETKALTIVAPTPTPDTGNFFVVDSPKDAEVLTKKTITVSGKTLPDATIIISSETGDDVIKPASNGSFSVTHTIGADSNLLSITSVFPNGEEQTIVRTVNFSSEEF